MERKKIVTKKRLAGAVSAVAAVALLVTGTFAWNDYTQHKTNAFVTSEVLEVTLNDLFTPPDNWSPTDLAVSKKISVTNTENSGANAFVRVQIKEYLEYTNYDVIKDGTEEVLFATFADGARKGEFLTYAEASATGLAYTPFDVGGVEYARTNNAELRNGIYGKHMYMPGAEVVFGTALKADYPNQPHEQQSPTNAECMYNHHAWDTCGINAGADNIHNHIQWNKGTQTISMQEWIDAGGHTGNFWVLDTDGWAYWANALAPNTSTENILESVQLLNMPGNEFEYYMHVDMEAVTQDELEMLKTRGATTNGSILIDKLKQTDTGWTNNGDGTATQYILVGTTLTSGATVIVGLDGIPGTSDDNAIVNPAGTVIKANVTVSRDGTTPYVDLGNGFHLYPGEDGKIGTQDDIIPSFGMYAQTDTTGATAQPMSWKLLDINANNEAVIVSNTVIDNVNYKDGILAINTTYENSTYRSWLNGTFYNGAFSAGEKGKILTTTVTMPKETFNAVDGIGDLVSIIVFSQNSTNDKVFALSIGETIKYFGSDSHGNVNAMIEGNAYSDAKGTVHATSGAYSGNARWLTRSGGIVSLLNVSGIDVDGDILAYLSVLDDSCGALPAVTVKLTP